MLQSTSEYEQRNFDDIQRALDIEHTVKALEAQLCYDQHSPEEVARQILKAACKFYDADWCGLIQVDLDLKIWTPFWWYNDSSEDKTTILTEEFESAEFIDRWVQAVRHGKPMIVPDAEEVKNTYPAEYNLYQRLGIRSVLGASLEPRPVALLAVRNPKRYISETSILRLLAYVLLVAYKDKKMNDGLNMAFAPENIESSHDVFVSLFGELKIYTSHGILREADLKSPKISRLLTYLLISGKKTALFLIMSDTDATFNFLISMIYTQLFNLLCEKADDVYGGRLPVHVRCLIDEAANIGQIPNLEKLVATIRSREISACLVLQAQSQLKAIYKDNSDTIIGNMDSRIFLGGSEPTTLKELNQALGKETIDTYNTSNTRGNSPSYGMNYQKLGKDLATVDELAVLDGGKCILQLRGVRPFLSDKYDLTQHPNYKYTSDFDKKNEFNIEQFLSRRLKLKAGDEFVVVDAD